MCTKGNSIYSLCVASFLFTIVNVFLSMEVILMRILAKELEEGYILEKDILGKTGKPIVKERTVLTEEHIRFIHAFLVDYVQVSQKTMHGDVVVASEQSMQQRMENKPQTAIRLLYEDTVQFMKNQFKKWEQHQPIDMPSVRYQLLPLLNRVEEDQAFLFSMHTHVSKEDYMYHHSVAVSMLATYLARKIGYSHGESIQIGMAALFSDSGMTQIDAMIRTSDRPLNMHETQLVHEHPLYSYRLVDPIQTMNQGAKVAVLQHHERLNGTGYPLGVQGKRIHPYAHIIAVCDMYHAMASDRPYQQRKTVYQICEELWQERNVTLKGSIVESFVEEFAPLSIGDEVVLSNETRGKVVFIDPFEPLRPTVQINDTDTYVALQEQKNLYIDVVYATS